MNVKILTWNILSQNLAELMINEKKNNKFIYTSNIINSEHRWNLISTHLQNVISNSKNVCLIICLQEVPNHWISMFASLFALNYYLYFNKQYGRDITGNMGCLMAYPANLSVDKFNFFQVGAHVKITEKTSNKLLPILTKAASKPNIAIMAKFNLIESNMSFAVITYHMPCQPDIPLLSLIHCKILYKQIRKFTNCPWIFGGDFNFLPDSIAYKYMTSNVNCLWKFLKKYPITNYSYISDKEFSGCIDYVFFNGFKPLKLKIIPPTNIIPDKNNPSDHVSIIGTFLF